MRTREARYLKVERSALYVNGLILRDPVTAIDDHPGAIVKTGNRRECERFCREYGYFFNAPK